MAEGFRPGVRRAELPLTKAAAAVTAGGAGVDLEGYRDYRGVPVVGAWQWLPKYDMGLITEIDHAEAYRPLTILQWAFFSHVRPAGGQLGGHLRLHAGRRPPAARSPEGGDRSQASGPISPGGEARRRGDGRRLQGASCHAPPADGDQDAQRRTRSTRPRSSGSSAKCRSPASSTIPTPWPSTTTAARPKACSTTRWSISTASTCRRSSSATARSPRARVIRILQADLRLALRSPLAGPGASRHQAGQHHAQPPRRRAGRGEGARFRPGQSARRREASGRVAAASLTGTPLYMSPEAIQSRPRSMPAAICMPSARSATSCSPASRSSRRTTSSNCASSTSLRRRRRRRSASRRRFLARVGKRLLACLEKSRAKRPQTARDLSQLIARCPEATAWSIDDADAWWGRHERGQIVAPAPAASLTTRSSGEHAMTIDHA